jgi:competence protein ComEC
MTGGKATAIRAGFMAILMLFARATGRNYDTARALVIVAILMIFLNPFILAFDVSFQLSFMATLAVIFLSPKLEKYFLWLPSFFNLRDIASVTFSAYIFVMPFILYKMGNLSLVALPANVLIIPFIPISMLLGFLSGILGFLWHLLSIPFSFLAYLFLHYQLLIVKFFSQLPFASFTIPNFPLLITILIYIYFIYFLFKEEIKNFFKN